MINSILDVFGIHVGDIDHAYKECEEALTKVFLSAETDRLEEYTKDKLKELIVNGTLDLDYITDTIIELMFRITRRIIELEYPDLEIECYVNGYDSHFYVMDDDLFEILSKARINPDVIKLIMQTDLANIVPLDDVSQTLELATDEKLVRDIIKGIKNGYDFTVYESVEELGFDHMDDSRRKDNDTDESFGRFLVQLYENGNSNIVYHEFKNGKVIAIGIM